MPLLVCLADLRHDGVPVLQLFPLCEAGVDTIFLKHCSHDLSTIASHSAWIRGRVHSVLFLACSQDFNVYELVFAHI